MSANVSLQAHAPQSANGNRLDQVAAELFPEYSRARLQTWIKEGSLLVDGRQMKAKAKLCGGEDIRVEAELASEGDWVAQNIPLDIIFEDDDLLVINKPAGLVVHPAAGNWDGTLLNGLLHYLPGQANLPRAGIVHRLDKETSGLMVVAKTLIAQANLVEQLQARSVSRKYRAIVQGEVKKEGEVEADIGRHPTQRVKMAVVRGGGKYALTHYTICEEFDGFTSLRLQLETGRTHQIRVHMAHINHPLVGDPVYGRPIPATRIRGNEGLRAVAEFPRQALHAESLSLIHPTTGKDVGWKVPLANDFQALLIHLREM